MQNEYKIRIKDKHNANEAKQTILSTLFRVENSKLQLLEEEVKDIQVDYESKLDAIKMKIN